MSVGSIDLAEVEWWDSGRSDWDRRADMRRVGWWLVGWKRRGCAECEERSGVPVVAVLVGARGRRSQALVSVQPWEVWAGTVARVPV